MRKSPTVPHKRLYQGQPHNPDNRGRNNRLHAAKAQLDARIAGYDETCKSRRDSGGFRRPGSMKVRSN